MTPPNEIIVIYINKKRLGFSGILSECKLGYSKVFVKGKIQYTVCNLPQLARIPQMRLFRPFTTNLLDI